MGNANTYLTVMEVAPTKHVVNVTVMENFTSVHSEVLRMYKIALIFTPRNLTVSFNKLAKAAEERHNTILSGHTKIKSFI